MVISLDSVKLTESEKEHLEGQKMLFHFGLEHRRKNYPLGTLLRQNCPSMSLAEFLAMAEYLKSTFPWYFESDVNAQCFLILVDENYQKSLPPLMSLEYRERVYGQIE